MASENREVVDSATLLERLNAELAERIDAEDPDIREELAGCTFRDVTWHEPDASGCNWSAIFTPASRNNPRGSEAIRSEIVQWARERYLLSE